MILMKFEASYIKLLKSGELLDRVKQLEKLLENCSVCPHECGINRFKQRDGVCRSGYLPYISSICDHHGEEPVLSGSRGSGTVFFGSCNLSCVFCQNHQISQSGKYFRSCEQDFELTAGQIFKLQRRFGVHNINFVSPSHFVPQMVRLIYEAAKLGLNVPVVYNSNGFDSLDTLKLLDGIIDIYLPDLKYADDEYAKKYSKIDNYKETAFTAVKEMFRQTGLLQTDKKGIARKGLIVRHLILPNDLAGSEKILERIAKEISPDITISLLSQYYPAHKAADYPLLSRRITYNEYLKAQQALEKMAMYKGFAQGMDAPDYYKPDFNNDHPFED